MKEFASSILPVLQMLVSFATLCGLLYAFKNFLQKPQKTVNEEFEEFKKESMKEREDLKHRLSVVETWRSGCLSRFENQDKSHRVTQKALLALIDKEIEDQSGTNREPAKELIEARQDLYQHLFEK